MDNGVCFLVVTKREWNAKLQQNDSFFKKHDANPEIMTNFVVSIIKTIKKNEYESMFI